MGIITRNILYRKPFNFASELPLELVYQILWYLPARDLKSIRLVNRLLANVGRENVFWSDLCRLKWSEKLCLQTIPVPTPRVPSRCSDDDDGMEDIDEEEESEPVGLDKHLLSMQNFQEHIFDELVPRTLYELVYYFPAFHLVEGSWLRAFNLVDQHMEISYLHATVRRDRYSISDTQWEFRFSEAIRSSQPHTTIHAFLDYRRDLRLHVVNGYQYWDEPFDWRPLANGTAIRVHEFPPNELGRNSDGYRTLTNQWVCMTSSSEHSFVSDLGQLSGRMIQAAIENGEVSINSMDVEVFRVGEILLKWIDAYSKAPGDKRSCWVGAKKKLAFGPWRDADDSDEEEDTED